MPWVRVRGRSMAPTLRPGQILWFSSDLPSTPARGEIVLVRLKDRLFLKRIVGLPGEHVDMRGARVQINGNHLPESYVPETASLEPLPDASWKLEPEAYFVLGDARDDSLDSRRFGPVRHREIIGRASWRLWPPALMTK